MIEKKTNLQRYLVLIFIKLLGAQEVPNTSSNETGSTNTLQPRLPDDDPMRFPNSDSGRYGNPTNNLNYPTDSFSPYGNQNNYIPQPEQGSGLVYPNQGNFQNIPQYYPNQQLYTNLQGYPYQGGRMNPNPNYQRPQYPNQNRPFQREYPYQGDYQYQGDSNTRYPNYQRPSYPNSQGYGSIMYPDDRSRPYQNGGIPTNQGGPGQAFQYPSQDNQYPSEINIQGTGNPNDRNPNFRPDDLSNLPDTNIPDVPNQYQPNQYHPQTNSQNQNFRPVQGQLGNYPSNTNPDTNIQLPTNYSGGENISYPSTTEYPNEGIPNPG